MKVLGIDTSTSCGCVGLIDDDRVISEYLLDISVTHSERLLRSIDHVLKESGHSMDDLEGWAISLGPGSFTGLRIGVSTLKGLAFATQKPVVGVPTLDALAHQVAPTPYLICPILDARKGEIYTAFYHYEEGDVLKRISAYQAVAPEDLVKRIEEKTIFIGNGAKTYGNDIRKALPCLATFPPAPLHLLHGSVVARLGLELLRKKEHLNLATFTPIYVRPSEAEIKWQEKHPT
ncbi:MAG: tRNA (adenosine(37)-N6)-threonylcarbamoyltransferase complex dimerization subunit type 1 TsaB, partial [Pseudomonadota bacterium]